MFFAVSVANNWALNFNIPMPLHMIFKSGSLVTSMFMGRFLLKKKYAFIKYFSVLMVSCGIFLATWASYRIKAETNSEINTPKNQSFIGIALMSFALILSAGLGIYQETLFKKYGKHPKEALFYSHALPLPGFLLLIGDIYPQLHLFSKSGIIELFLFNIPLLWLYLIGNVITQYICVRSVFTIAAKYSSLTVTMIITFRKFVSLIFSIIYFQNPFTNLHWFATFLVFAGTLLFTDLKNLRSQTKKLE
ncbi:nucleotide sugar transporter SLC35B4-like [Uloborus diversus]|nr:nucleotide sugar transporter SLC35B4-like [Uloborus diversus]